MPDYKCLNCGKTENTSRYTCNIAMSDAPPSEESKTLFLCKQHALDFLKIWKYLELYNMNEIYDDNNSSNLDQNSNYIPSDDIVDNIIQNLIE